MANQKTLAFTIQGGGVSNITPWIGLGHPVTTPAIRPRTKTADLPNAFYWVCILDAYRPGLIVVDFIIPAVGNPTLPSNLDDAMSDPDAIYVVATKQLSLQNVPTGAWYDFLVKYGAGSELQRLNQLSTTLQPGVFNGAGYVLTGQGGPRGGSNIPPPHTSWPPSLIRRPFWRCLGCQRLVENRPTLLSMNLQLMYASSRQRERVSQRPRPRRDLAPSQSARDIKRPECN